MWKELTDVQRASWEKYANAHPLPDWTGTPRRIPGYCWFVRANWQPVQMEQTPIYDPPKFPAPRISELVSASFGGGFVTFTFEAQGSPAPEYLYNEYRIIQAAKVSVQPPIDAAEYFDTLPNDDGTCAIPETTAGRYWCWVRVIDMRTGLHSPWLKYSLDVEHVQTSEGPNSPSAWENETGSDVEWQNLQGIQTPDDASFAYTSMGSGQGYSKWLRGSDYGFSIPAEATIDGIEVILYCFTDFSEGTDVRVQLVKNGAGIGEIKYPTIPNDTEPVELILGDESDMWGAAWTPADINAADFGIRIRTEGDNRTNYVDWIGITVYYTT